jgi:NAD(P)-dependent dehydrogenase (short-subunit alcohol dehydrogenase family)
MQQRNRSCNHSPLPLPESPRFRHRYLTVQARTYGPKIDVLANVAGVMDAFGSADTVTEAEWGRVISINLTVPVQLMQAVLPSMKENKSGSIINVASYAAISGASAGVAYTASKHGLVGATKNVAWRFHEQGIRCNAVLPGGKSSTSLG